MVSTQLVEMCLRLRLPHRTHALSKLRRQPLIRILDANDSYGPTPPVVEERKDTVKHTQPEVGFSVIQGYYAYALPVGSSSTLESAPEGEFLTSCSNIDQDYDNRARSDVPQATSTRLRSTLRWLLWASARFGRNLRWFLWTSARLRQNLRKLPWASVRLRQNLGSVKRFRPTLTI